MNDGIFIRHTGSMQWVGLHILYDVRQKNTKKTN